MLRGGGACAHNHNHPKKRLACKPHYKSSCFLPFVNSVAKAENKKLLHLAHKINDLPLIIQQFSTPGDSFFCCFVYFIRSASTWNNTLWKTRCRMSSMGLSELMENSVCWLGTWTTLNAIFRIQTRKFQFLSC